MLKSKSRIYLFYIILLASTLFTGVAYAQEVIWQFDTDLGYNEPPWVEELTIINDVSGNGIPEVVAGTVGYGYNVFCIDGETGALVWDYPMDRKKVGDLKTLEDINCNGSQEVLVAEGFRLTIPPTHPEGAQLYCLDGETGEEIWAFTPDPQGFIPALEIIDDVTGDGFSDVIASSDSGWVAVVDGFFGNAIWASRVDGLHAQAVSAIADVDGDDISDVLIGNWDMSGPDCGAYCFSGVDGSLIWEQTVGNIQSNCVKSVPDLDDDGIDDAIVGTLGGEVYAFSGTGSPSPIWMVLTEPAQIIQEVVITQDINDDGKSEVIAGSWNNNVYCFDGASGDILWSYAVINWVHTVAVAGDVSGDGVDDILAGDRGDDGHEGSVYCIDGALGDLLWRYETNDMVWAVSKIDDVNDNGITDVIAGSDDGFVYCLEGNEEIVGIKDNTPTVPIDFSLSQNYPNPFNAQTTIQYSLPEAAHVVIDIYNLAGQKIETLIAENKQAGCHQIIWDASEISSGIYFYRLTADDFSQSKRMLFLK